MLFRFTRGSNFTVSDSTLVFLRSPALFLTEAHYLLYLHGHMGKLLLTISVFILSPEILAFPTTTTTTTKGIWS